MSRMFAAVILLAGAAAAATAQKYTTKYDGIDIDSILQNDRLLNNYFNCIMDKGKCSPDGQELKKHLPDALENECVKCSEKQKAAGDKVLKFLLEKKPEMFRQLETKYDPDGKYRIKYRSRVEQIGVKL